MILGRQKVYNLSIEFCPHRKLSLVFTEPPVREDVYSILKREWNKLMPQAQDQVWEFILICDHIPLIPWLGNLDTIYGKMECTERYIFQNGPREGVTADGTHES